MKKKIIQVFLEVNQFSDGVERKLKGNFGQLSQISCKHRIRSRVFWNNRVVQATPNWLFNTSKKKLILLFKKKIKTWESFKHDLVIIWNQIMNARLWWKDFQHKGFWTLSICISKTLNWQNAGQSLVFSLFHTGLFPVTCKRSHMHHPLLCPYMHCKF